MMDSADFSRNHVAVDQAFTDLPAVYKSELSNRLYSTYCSDSISTDLRGNIEFSAPILWSSLTKEDKKQIGKRFDKNILEADAKKIERGLGYIKVVGGLMYVNSASRRVIIGPLVQSLESALDDWDKEGSFAKQLQPLARFIPDELRQSFVHAITRTYVGYKGNSSSYARTNFYSNTAATYIKEMFQSFDSASTDCFVETVKEDTALRRRIKEKGQLDRLREGVRSFV